LRIHSFEHWNSHLRIFRCHPIQQRKSSSHHRQGFWISSLDFISWVIWAQR
jgi:hypothetical protein